MGILITYFKLGLGHITDIKGYDHILFLLSLSTLLFITDWHKIFILVTAFTIGHSISLALAVFCYFRVNVSLIELLIPITILIMSIKNIYNINSNIESPSWISYLIVIFFGLIHGLGFSNFFMSIYSDGMEILIPLFSFNIGLEIGQIIIVIFILFIKYLLTVKNLLSLRDTVMLYSGICIGLSVMMIMERIILLKI